MDRYSHTDCWLPEMFYKEVLNAPYALWNGKTESHESLVPLNCYLLFPASNWSLLTQLTNLRKDTSNISVEWWKCNWIFLKDGAQRQVKVIVAFAVFLLFFLVFSDNLLQFSKLCWTFKTKDKFKLKPTLHTTKGICS